MTENEARQPQVSARQPDVSVVIPVYCHTADHEGFLRETLASVAAQTFRDFEVVVIDDVSPIDIGPIVQSVPDLPNVRVIRNAENLRQAESRNRGVRESQAHLIAFLDHDDLWHPDKLERQVKVLNDNPDAAMVFCDSETFGEFAHRLDIDQSIIPQRPDFCWFVSHGNFTITASAVMLRKQMLMDAGLFDRRYSTCDDFDAWLRLLMRAPIVHLPQTLVKYRMHQHNVNYSVDRLNDNKLLTSLVLRYFRSAPVNEKIKLLPRIARKLVGRVYFTFARRRKFKDGG